MTARAAPALSLGELRQLLSWRFLRDEPVRSAKKKPHTEAPWEIDRTHTARTYRMRQPGLYLVDTIDDSLARRFFFVELVAETGFVELTRDEAAQRCFELTGRQELEEAQATAQWQAAWELVLYAPPDEQKTLRAQLHEVMRARLSSTEEVTLEGLPKQIQWAEPLRAAAVELLRVTWRSLRSNPELVAAQPRLSFALVTAAWHLKTSPHAALFIALDYHITRANISELVDRFAAHGKRLHRGTGRAPQLSDDELSTIQRLAGAIKR